MKSCLIVIDAQESFRHRPYFTERELVPYLAAHNALIHGCAAAGVHVFCEKPLAHSVEEARDIREIARKTKLVTQVGTQGGSTATFRRSMELIQAGPMVLDDTTGNPRSLRGVFDFLQQLTITGRIRVVFGLRGISRPVPDRQSARDRDVQVG